MTSSEIRQSFLDFFVSKQHTIVPSASLLPDSPNLLFTNAGMNQFVPIFLGQQKPEVDKWPGAIPGLPTRAADTQKCIRAGGKHNDLDDVGLDTYHLTFFEMLGNWSFGDYFKKESLTWGWELFTKVWGIPPKRLFATVYAPDESKGDPAEFDQEASDIWTEIFRKEGLDPKVHIVHGNKKDNFWMMGETGPCGPCSEIHFNLLPSVDEPTGRALVNAGSQRCIEIWNHVFIQFNANPDGTYSPLPARHVDTGMGFDRIAGFYAGTKGFKQYSELPSAYNTDIFTALFAELGKLSGKKYTGTLPKPGSSGETAQEKIDIAFRVIADHIRTLSFAIADGIQPGNTDRNYVLRRILRRAVRYGRTLGFHEPFFYKLVDVLVDTMGGVFPEIREKQKHVKEVIRLEEEAFNKTLDSGIKVFEDVVRLEQGLTALLDASRQAIESVRKVQAEVGRSGQRFSGFSTFAKLEILSRFMASRAIGLHRESKATPDLWRRLSSEDEAELILCADRLDTSVQKLLNPSLENEHYSIELQDLDAKVSAVEMRLSSLDSLKRRIRGAAAFLLYDTYGFPLDLTELLARERGLTVDVVGFNKLMEEQRTRARSAQKKTVIEVDEDFGVTEFVGYETLATNCRILSFLDKVRTDGGADVFVITDRSSLYAEMGGQVGDAGRLEIEGLATPIRIARTVKRGSAFYHAVHTEDLAVIKAAKIDWTPTKGQIARLVVDSDRRNAIQRHHTVTHLLHWALHEIVSREASQKGSFVGPDKLTFDFNCAPLTPQQVADIEKLVNERILENAGVSWTEVPYPDVKNRKDVMQFFGDKYGDTVRVVQIGGLAGKLDGFSLELCGGTHTRATGEIGLFRIVGESAIAAGVRRIEAVAGFEAYRKATDEVALIKMLAGKVNSPVQELDKKIEALLAHQKELEKRLKTAEQKEAASTAQALLARLQSAEPSVSQPPLRAIIENLGVADGDYLQAVADALKGQFKGVVVLGGVNNGAVALVASVSPEFTAKVQAGKIIQTIAPIVGGKGGGKPDNARGGGKDATKLDEALAKARTLVAAA